MPIFQDPDHQDSFHKQRSLNYACGNDLQRSTHPVTAGPEDMNDDNMSGMSPNDAKMDLSNLPKLETSDRGELIWRIKRGESPTWVPNRSLGEYFANHSDPPQARKQKTPPLLPPADIRESPKDTSSCIPLDSACDIERPRSALHSGDFREGSPQNPDQQHQPQHFEREQNHTAFGSSPTTPWYTPTRVPLFESLQEGNAAFFTGSQSAEALRRSRAPSFGSFSSSSYVLKAPTSPLVHEAHNSDLDFSPKIDVIDLSTSSGKANRRRTLPPETFRSVHPSHLRGINFTKPSGSWRREGPFPYQAHQPHNRSLASAFSLQSPSSCQTASILRPRRPSYSSDVSPLHHASMVGSYEESILRGRMSTSPSKPLDFTAQIGVLGRGNCKSNLKCPPHVTVPFPAVFYSYATSGSGRSISDDSPSPYVGLIDLENSLSNEDRASHRYRRRHTSPLNNCDLHSELSGTPGVLINAQQERRKREKRSRRSQSPKSPVGGSYRIPQQGQLQIIIKNPNKTAVKLFLVPYDLEGMEPGTKTFIRQRSYSAGPVIDMPLTARMSPGTTCIETSLSASGTPEAKPILRYLIHLNICCPSKGRYYLHSGIRVVFANRVPDGKEQLRNEIQYPEPRYSPYKVAKDGAGLSSAGAKLAAEKAFRRRSSGFGLGSHAPIEADHFVLTGSPLYRYYAQPPPLPLLVPIPFQLFPRSAATVISPGSDPQNIEMGLDFSPPNKWSEPSPLEPAAARPLMHDTLLIPFQPPGQPLSSTDVDGSKSSADTYSKLSRGDIGYGGNLFGISPNGSEAGESLLARELRSLDVIKRESQESE